MSEFEDKINALLNDPGQMEKISKLAAKFMGAGDDGGAPAAEQSGGSDIGIDPDMMTKLSRLMFKADSGGDKTALLRAMEPYLAKERREKMEKAIKFARIAKIASTALREYGGDGDV